MNDPLEPIRSPHDKLFKVMFGYVEVTRDCLARFLDVPLTAGLNWPSLLLRPGTFVDQHLSERSSDLLFSIEFRASPLLLYLLWEHKSYVEKGICFQLLGCLDRIWADCRKRGEEPPPILPVVFYHGKEPWTAPRRLSDSLRMPEDMRPLLVPMQADFSYVLADLSEVDWEEFRENAALALTVGLMKAWAEGNVEQWLRRSWPVWEELMRQERQGDKAGQVRTLLVYLFQVDSNMNCSKLEQLVEAAEPEVKDKVMSIAEELMERGKQEGRQEGRQEGWQEGRREGLLIGQIQAYQKILNEPVIGAEQLRDKSLAELAGQLAQLEEAARLRFR